jgi:uncharacterized membrane protein
MLVYFVRKASLFIIIFTAAVLSACSRQPSYPPPPLSGSEVSIPVSSLQLEVPQFYTYPVNGKHVNFFVVRLNDRILSFLDACVTCYTKKRGYEDRHGYVVCRACDTSYSLYKLEKGIGGCYPIKIEGRTENGNYRIPISTLENSANRF